MTAKNRRRPPADSFIKSINTNEAFVIQNAVKIITDALIEAEKDKKK